MKIILQIRFTVWSSQTDGRTLLEGVFRSLWITFRCIEIFHGLWSRDETGSRDTYLYPTDSYE